MKNTNNHNKDLNKKKSKTTQLNDNDIIPINSTQLEQSSNDEYPFSLTTNKFRLEKEKQFFIPNKNKLYDNYKHNHKQKSKDLIIDTRNPSLSLMNDKKHKFNYIDYRHKKYQKHIFPFKIIKPENKSYEKNNNLINYINTENESIKEENLTLEQKVNNMKYQFIKAPINGYLPNFALTYSHLPHKAVSNSLYTVLAIRKNQFIDGYHGINEKENLELPELKEMKYLLNTNNNSPMSSYFGRKDEYRKYVDLLNQPFSYISLLNDDYSISEKMRFQKMMDTLNKVKKCIEEKPDEEFEIAKEFILSIGLYDFTNLDIEKLNNFLKFIKTDFLIDPSKNMKENVMNILNKNNICKPSISKALDCINEDYILNELQKKKNLIKHKNIGEMFTSFNDNYTELNKNKGKSNNIKTISKLKESVKNISLNSYNYKEEKKNSNKNIRAKTFNNNILKPRPLEHKGLCVDLKRQQKINLLQKKKDLDIVNSPRTAVDLIKKEIIESNCKDKIRARTHYNWCKNVTKNKRLYGAKRQENAEYNAIKKKNMLTEYICLMKAKNNMKLSNLKEKYKL